MVTGAISPLEMRSLSPDGAESRIRTTGRRMTLAAVPQPRAASMVFDTSAVDATGRIVARAAIRSLVWVPGDRLHIRAADGLIMITADPAGRRTLTAHGNLTLPIGLRSLCGLATGARVLLAADPGRKRLLVYPPGLLGKLLTQHQAEILGGDA